MSNRLLIVGFACCALALLLPPLGAIALVIGILALIRGRRTEGVVLVVLGALLPLAGAAILQAFIVKPYRVPGEAMVPTLAVGDRFLAWRAGAEPAVGDVVVFSPPASADTGSSECGARHDDDELCPVPTQPKADVNFVKRIVAGPGDSVALLRGRVIRNGRRQREPYAAACGGGAGCDFPQAVRVPAGHWFMMGDNRGASDDSRYWGPVPGDWIVGRAIGRYWPAGRIGGL